MLCIQYQHQEMGLVFLAVPKEFLHGFQKAATHLEAKGGLGIASLLLKLPPMKPGGLFSCFHVVMNEVQEACENSACSSAPFLIFF